MDNFNDPNQLTACQLYYDCISGDKERQRRGYENLGRYLYPWALRYADIPQNAEDLTQITLERVWLKIEQVNSCEAFKTWTQIVLRHEWNRLYHKEKKHHVTHFIE